MKILHIASGDLWAGAEVQLFSQASATAAIANTEQEIVLLNHGLLEQRLRARDIAVTVLDESRLSAVALIRGIRSRIQAFGPDIVHTHRRKENVLGAIAARLAGDSISVRTEHGMPEFHPQRFEIGQKIINFLDGLAARRWQRAVVAVSAELRQKLQYVYGQKVHFIPNGIDVSDFPQPKAPRNASDRRPLQVAFAGRLVPVKRVDLFVDIARHAKTSQPGLFEFRIYGDGPEQDSIQALVSKYALEDTVKLMGFSADLRSSLAQADILMITSDHEGLPMVLLEAVQLRVAVIARSVGEIPTVLLHGKGGQLIAGTDSADYFAAMMNVVESPDAIATACSVAQENLQREYTADVCATRYLSLYERLRLPAANDD